MPETNDENKEQGKASANPNPNKESKTPLLDELGTDLTSLARENRLDPVIGRAKETERVTQILSRRKKNNVILLGSAGCGKTSLAHAVALGIAQRTISPILFDKRVVELELSSLVAGSKYRGELEERVKKLIEECVAAGNIILFVDEVASLSGAGGASGSLDVSNMFKPHLSSGRLQIIGATTEDEYQKNLEKDAALTRRFQKVKIKPTSKEDTLIILNNIKEHYEKHHKVVYTDEAIKACVDLSSRYVSNERVAPDNAIDVLDEAGSRVQINNVQTPENIVKLEGELEEIKEIKTKAVKSQKYEEAAKLRDSERAKIEEIDTAKAEWVAMMDSVRIPVTVADVAEVVSLMSGVPCHNVDLDDKQKLKRLESDLKKRIVGQDNALEIVSNAIRRSRLNVREVGRSMGSFMFVGASGVGKTESCKAIAELLNLHMVRIDMNEFSDNISSTKLLGSSAGFVGFNDTTTPLDEIRRNNHCLVLLDEIEKAAPNIKQMFLTALDEGYIKDNRNVKIDLTNSIIIMTSNAGIKALKNFGTGIGFGGKSTEQEEYDKEQFLRKEIEKEFSPEFINRIDEIVYFNSLSGDMISEIVKVEMNKFVKRLKEIAKLNVTYTEELVTYLQSISFDPMMGARPLKRHISKVIETKLTNEMLEHDVVDENSNITICYKDNDVLVTITRNEGAETKAIESTNN